MSQVITTRHIQEGMSYEQYKTLIDTLLLQKKTTGDNHSPEMVAYTKLICLDNDLQEMGTWGPRPAPAQQMLRDYKASPEGSYPNFVARVQSWYAHDKIQTMQQEFIQVIKAWNHENQSVHL